MYVAGVVLYLEDGRNSRLPDGRLLQNNTLISGDNLTSTYGLACYSARTDSDEIGEWRFPDGTNRVSSNGQVMFSNQQIGRVTLQIREGRQFTSSLEGVYTCMIPDETGAVRTLYAGVYTADNYTNSGTLSSLYLCSLIIGYSTTIILCDFQVVQL